MMQMPNNEQLLNFIREIFNEEELDGFIFIYFEELGEYLSNSMSEIQKIIELIQYCKRNKSLDALLQALQKAREQRFDQWQEELSATKESANILPSPTLEETPQTYFHEKTGLSFVRVPAGEFLFGDDPPTQMNLPEFWISKTLVTNSVYKRFIDENPAYRVPRVFLGMDYNWDKDKRTFANWRADHPVTLVSWDDAMAFCQWAGVSMPTEMQWEKAARGTDGRFFPWGNHVPTSNLCNFDDNEEGTTPVGRYSPQGDSPYGCVDMSGNVCEWCLANEPVLQNGGWDSSPEKLRVYYKDDNLASLRVHDNGFRVVLNVLPA